VPRFSFAIDPRATRTLAAHQGWLKAAEVVVMRRMIMAARNPRLPGTRPKEASAPAITAAQTANICCPVHWRAISPESDIWNSAAPWALAAWYRATANSSISCPTLQGGMICPGVDSPRAQALGQLRLKRLLDLLPQLHRPSPTAAHEKCFAAGEGHMRAPSIGELNNAGWPGRLMQPQPKQILPQCCGP